MATYTKSAKGFGERATWTCTVTSNTSNINVTGDTFSINALMPTVTGKITMSRLEYGNFYAYIYPLINGNLIWINNDWYYCEYSLEAPSWASNASKSIPLRSSGITLRTATFFSSTNKTVRKLSVAYNNGTSSFRGNAGNSEYADFLQGDTLSFNFSQTITLDVPPTFSEAFSYTGDFSGVPYAGLTTANVSLSSLKAYYGGDFTGVGKAEFTIGSQTVSKANPVNNDVLSIPLNVVGTFTPTVKITDSRGQVATHTLNAITVQGYVAPSVNFSVERTTSTGTPDDEGVQAVISTTFNFTEAIATLSAPTIAVTDDDGVTQTVSTTWYSSRASDGTLSSVMSSSDWASLSSGDTVYGLVSITGDFNTQKSYQIAITPQDSEGTGTTITQTLGSAFYTVDFYAGGHGIAFGQPASQDGFFCNMDAHFVDKADVMRALFDFIHPVGSYYETSDTSFNPNTTWGGTWVLETEGLVHISAGTNYPVSGAPTDTKDGGNKDAIVPYHNHSVNSASAGSHNHGIAQRSGSGTTNTGWHYELAVNNSDGPVYNTNSTTNRASSAIQYAGVTMPAHNTNYAGTSGNATNANMQPYIIVNRWHRTA